MGFPDERRISDEKSEPSLERARELLGGVKVGFTIFSLEPLTGIEPVATSFITTSVLTCVLLQRIRLYLGHDSQCASFSPPCQSFERLGRYGLTPPRRGFNRNSGFKH